MSQPYSTSDKSLMDNNYYQQYPQQQYPQQYTQPQYPQQYTQPQYPQQYTQPQYQQQYTQPQYQQQQFPQEQQQYPNYSQQQNSSPGIDYSADVVYKDMSQKEWAEIQADKTEYSHYWDNPDAFKPETFSNNTTKETKWVNLPWTIAFWIQFLVSIGLFIYLIQVVKNNNKTSNSVESTADELVDSVGKIFIYSFLIGLVTNIIHILYAIFCPKVYIQFGFWLSFAFILAITFLIYLFVPYYALFGFPGFIFFLAFIYYCICRQYIPFSTAVFSYSCSLIIKYPSILFFTTLTGIVVSVVEGLFTAMAILCFYSDLKYYYILFLWTLFSFFWTSLTFSYVGYMTGAGAAATAYFLDGTPQMPAHPVCSSFGRSVTSTFGAASLAGFILALIKFFRYLAEQLMESDNFIAVLIGCIIDCILCCIEAFVSFLNQYGLIYCATFGIPYQEGCRRFMELSSKKFVDVIFSGSIIDRAIGFNMFVFSLLAAVIGFGVGYAMYPNDYLFALIICIVSLVFAYGIFFIYEAPLEVYPNTIFVCFAECPEVLASKSHELSETIWQLYHTSVSSLTGQKIKSSRRRKNK